MARILVVDDDPHIREVLAYALEQAGHQVTQREDGRTGLSAALSEAPELIVLDIMMPGLDGIEVCRRIRARSTVPILFLSARDDEIDRIIGLEVGGDDYVSKPFGPREIVARVKAMLRRVELIQSTEERDRPSQTVFVQGDLSLDVDRFEVEWQKKIIVLTVTEFGLLEALMRNPGKVHTRSELVELAYRFDNHVTERTIDTHVRRIRKKFDSDGQPIDTVFGLGYRLASCRV